MELRAGEAMPAKVLYVSGSLGLGHISRNLAIARELQCSQARYRYLVAGRSVGAIGSPQAGERLHLLADACRSDTPVAESIAREGELNLLTYAFKASPAWLTSVQVVRRAIREDSFDILVGRNI